MVNPAGGDRRSAVLLVESDAAVGEAVVRCLAGQGCKVLRASALAEAVEVLQRQDVQVVLAEVREPPADGFELLRYVKTNHPEAVVVFTTEYGSIESAVEAIRQGAFDYLPKPIVDDDLRLVVGRALQQQRLLAENRRLKAAVSDLASAGRIIGSDYRMMKVFELIDAVADSRATVLITGESGTGKSLVARAVHQRSGRREGPFVEVACGALPETLLESELFGHVKGAFTDAVGDRVGKFAAADAGTIFLDEVSTASPALQMKLLRVLQERTFEPVGANRTATVDVRVILATNRDLWAEVEAGRFRRDLYYRVNVVNIELPPLRERIGDIPLLAEHFLARFGRENGKLIAGFTDPAVRALQSYTWPGNVRELENCVERAVVLCRGARIELEHLPAEVSGLLGPLAGGAGTADPAGPPAGCSLAEAMAEPEKQIIRATLSAHGGNRKATARALGINRTTLYKKMRKHGLLDTARPRAGA
jgi:two-component system response regulator AtoC